MLPTVLPALAAMLVTAAPTAPAADTAAAVRKALPLLRKGAEGHIKQRTCFACHNQALPMLALTAARQHGIAVDAAELRRQTDFIACFLDGNRAKYREGKGQGGQADTASYALLTLELGGRKPDATTEAVVEYLLLRDKERDHWCASGHRPPSEGSEFTVTYVALRALRHWSTPAQQQRVAKRRETVRGWLLKTPAHDTEDRVFRLRGLQEVGADVADVRKAARELMQSQRPDGGWAQADKMNSDAYATGSVLVALHDAGGLAGADPVYQRGLAWLRQNQRPDGTWFVHSRSKPFQTYFESGFPYGKDQFISIAATGWATTALALAIK